MAHCNQAVSGSSYKDYMYAFYIIYDIHQMFLYHVTKACVEPNMRDLQISQLKLWRNIAGWKIDHSKMLFFIQT